MVESSDGVRAKMTRDWREGWDRATSCLLICDIVVGWYETSLLISPTVEDGSCLLRVRPLEVRRSGQN